MVWICVGGSPTSGPQERKDVTFKDIPELHKDDALWKLEVSLGERGQDPELVVMMAIPGSGKSRTVMSACQRMKLQQVRVKLLEVWKEEIDRVIEVGRSKSLRTKIGSLHSFRG